MDSATASIYLMGPTKLDRLAFRHLLREELGVHVQLESSFAPVEVWDALRALPDIAIVLADTPNTETRDVVAMIPRLSRSSRIMVLSGAFDPKVMCGWASCGISAYVVKDAGVSELGAALQALRAGGEHFPAAFRDAAQTAPSTNGRHSLSRRESELLPLLARGLSLRDAAKEMMVSYKTADSYRTNLLRKLGLRDRVELALYAIRERIIEA